MVHPGFVDNSLATVSSLVEGRAAEQNALSDPRLPGIIRAAGFTLAGFGDLRP